MEHRKLLFSQFVFPPQSAYCVKWIMASQINDLIFLENTRRLYYPTSLQTSYYRSLFSHVIKKHAGVNMWKMFSPESISTHCVKQAGSFISVAQIVSYMDLLEQRIHTSIAMYFGITVNWLSFTSFLFKPTEISWPANIIHFCINYG